MLTVTKPALVRLSRRLDRKDAAEGMALRFKRRDGGWELMLDHESDGDTAFAHDGRKVLLLDDGVAKSMANLTLDAKRIGRGSGLKLSRNEHRQD